MATAQQIRDPNARDPCECDPKRSQRVNPLAPSSSAPALHHHDPSFDRIPGVRGPGSGFELKRTLEPKRFSRFFSKVLWRKG